MRFVKEDTILKAPYSADYVTIKRNTTYPYARIRYHGGSEYALCNNSSCFKTAKTIEEIFDAKR